MSWLDHFDYTKMMFHTSAKRNIAVGVIAKENVKVLRYLLYKQAHLEIDDVKRIFHLNCSSSLFFCFKRIEAISVENKSF